MAQFEELDYLEDAEIIGDDIVVYHGTDSFSAVLNIMKKNKWRSSILVAAWI